MESEKMNYLLTLDDERMQNRSEVGGKGFALARLFQAGFPVPKTCIISTEIYRNYTAESGVTGRIALELSRKSFDAMRWEEIWDTSLRIRNLFSRTPFPKELQEGLADELEKDFRDLAAAVRSSAADEDAEGQSFAGIHESYCDIKGIDEIMKHIRLVWASLWSDTAILYREELALTIEESAMAVVIQEFVPGEVSGVAFGRNPLNPEECVIETVPGFNENLVDGKIEPDRWILDRADGKILSVYHAPGSREEFINPEQIKSVYDMVREAEGLFGSPQDMEWTFCKGKIFALQSRPITGKKTGEKKVTGIDIREGRSKDKRSWYISLSPNYDRLKSLQEKIEGTLIPALIQTGRELAETDLEELSDKELQEEIVKRKQIKEHWLDIYWEEFIPFAHGMRLFGKFYNDVMKPRDPFEFIEVLRPENLESLKRNQLLDEIAEIIRKNPEIRDPVSQGNFSMIRLDSFRRLWHEFEQQSGTMLSMTGGDREMKALGGFLLEAADSPSQNLSGGKDTEGTIPNTEQFLNSVPSNERDFAEDMLKLGRSSYRLRDDDNIYLGLVEKEYDRAILEKQHRSGGQKYEASGSHEVSGNAVADRVRERQLTGQPAGSGLVTGAARVIKNKEDLFGIKKGEILICDALDPNMTFAIPLAGGIVERRGGMLIHGAIIAREYGLPCVTGIPDVTEIVRTGDRITVDGYLGIVVLHPGYSD